MSPLLRVEMFGGLRVSSREKAAIEIPPQLAGALLAYLALHTARQHSREELAETFWPDEEGDTARHRLRHTLHVLRGQLEQPPLEARSVLVATRSTVRIDPASITTDVADFEHAVAAGVASAAVAQRIGHLEHAIDMYRGELLPGYYQDAFVTEQRRLVDLFWKALKLLREAYEESGQQDRALECARRAVTIDPLSEGAHRALLRLYSQTGQPSAAIRQVHEMERVLREQLGSEPSAETRALIESLGNGRNGCDRIVIGLDPPGAPTESDLRTGAGALPPAPLPYSPTPPLTTLAAGIATVPAIAARHSAGPPRAWAVAAAAVIALNAAVLVWFVSHVHGVSPAAGGGLVRSVPVPRIAELWAARYAREPDEADSEPTAMALDQAGNVFVTGFVQTAKHDVDYLTVAIAPSGRLLWRARYNGTGNDVDRARSIAVDAGGNVCVTGESDNGKGNGATRLAGLDIVTVKYDHGGRKLWEDRYNGADDGEDWGRKVAVDARGNIYVGGYSWIRGTPRGRPGFQTVVIKYSPLGERLWVRNYSGDGGEDYAYDMAVDPSGSVYLAGATRRGGARAPNLDFLTLKYDTSGHLLWARTRDGSGHGDDRAERIIVDATGTVFVGGTAYDGNHNNRGTENDYFVVRYSAQGNEQVAMACDSGHFGDDSLKDMAVDGNATIFMTGEMTMPDRCRDFGTCKFSSVGSLVWLETYNGPKSDNDGGTAMTLDRTGNVIVTGLSFNGETNSDGTRYDTVTLKYDAASGRALWSSRYNGPGSGDDVPAAIAADREGATYVALRSATEKSSDMVVLKYPARP